ncbi:ClbS/DfsB family four-helix bundle protein [Enterococcus sp. LJL99]
MARPTTKEDLLTAATNQFTKLSTLIDSLSLAEKEIPFDWTGQKIGKEAHWQRDENLKDVLIHLYEWHQLLLNWVHSNQAGEEKPFLPAPYNWRSYGAMNVEFKQKHQQTTEEQAEKMVKESHTAVIKLIESLSNEELFSKNHFTWAGGSTLGSYCVSATSSHYEWAIKKINKFKKTLTKGK